MGKIAERVRIYVEHEARTGVSAEATAGALRQATLPELGETSRLLNDAFATRAVDDADRVHLLTAHHGQIHSLIAKGQTGVHAISRERLEQHKKITLLAQAKGIFAGAVPTAEVLQAQVDHILGAARANEAAKADPLLTDATVAPALDHFLGINSGPDEIVEAVAHREAHNVFIDLFDRAGFHVMGMQAQAAGRALHVVELKATHGRNVEDLKVYRLQDKIPGRGNARLVAEGLQQMVQLAASNGFSSLSCVPANDEVAKLYAKMGFVADHDLETSAFNAMTLDLTNPKIVQQLVFVFAASRAGIRDVPKDVSAKMQARGEALSPPNRTTGKFAFQGVPRRAVMLEASPTP